MREAERDQRGAGGDRELRTHEVDAEHLLGDGVLDLEPRIGLDEGKRPLALPGFVIDQEFEGAEIVVARGGRELLRRLDDARAHSLAQRRARRHLDELLVAALDGAFALPEMADRAMAVTDNLHLDMARLADQPLDIDRIAAERRLGLRLAARIGLVEPGGILDQAHAAPAAAGDRLDHHGGAGAERGEERLCLVETGRARSAGNDRDAAFLRQRLCLGLVAEQIERLRRRADEGDPLLGTAPRELRVLAEEAVARMQRIATRGLGRRDDGLDVEIGPRAAAWNLVARVGGSDMQRGGIVGGMDRDGRDAAVGSGAGNPDRDLTAIGNQQFLERHHNFTKGSFV
ncbi:hypothetical protein AB7M56_005481 [Bradyrhizobium elkanii]